jgi:transcriptional regulator with XRE-family HTH domain
MVQAPQSIADLLRIEMAAGAWTNQRLGDLCGVHASLVSRWRNGKVIPQARNCECIARAFGLESQLVLRLAGHVGGELPSVPSDEWTAKQREWARRFERRVQSLRPDDDDCTERCISAWLDGFSLMVDRLATSPP